LLVSPGLKSEESIEVHTLDDALVDISTHSYVNLKLFGSGVFPLLKPATILTKVSIQGQGQKIEIEAVVSITASGELSLFNATLVPGSKHLTRAFDVLGFCLLTNVRLDGFYFQVFWVSGRLQLSQVAFF